METSIVPALAGLTGTAIGGLTSGIASWFAQKTKSRVQLARCMLLSLQLLNRHTVILVHAQTTVMDAVKNVLGFDK